MGSFSRREFCRMAGAAGVVALGGRPSRAFSQVAAGRGDRILVVVQLSGGNDGLNTVVPYGDAEYRRARPGIHLPTDSLLKLDELHGLHPSLRGVKSLWDEGRLAIVQGVGYPQPDRSHFRSMDIWHSAQPERTEFRDGWIGRAAANVSQPLEAMSLGFEKPPLACSGSGAVVPSVRNLDQFRLTQGTALSGENGDWSDQAVRQIGSIPVGAGASDDDLSYLRRSMSTALSGAQKLRRLANGSSDSAGFPATGLGRTLHSVSQLIAAELPARVYYVSLDGFDTHAQQQPAHAALLKELGDAVEAFFKRLAELGRSNDVALATFSEFGRRVAENGSLGTDHGAASLMFVAGPVARAGFVGQRPSLTNLDDGDLKHSIDFRSVYATLLESWLRSPSKAALGGEFPLLPLFA